MPTLELPADRRPDIVVHVGMGKTGTTTIQATFEANRERLAAKGILYPESPGPRRHLRLGLAMQPDTGRPHRSVGWRRQAVSSPEELRPLFEKALFAELRQRPRHVVFSDEALLASSPEGIANLRELFDRMAGRVRVVAYLRRQDDHLCSRYQQRVKREGEFRRLADRAKLDLTSVYDYHAQLVGWRDLMRPDALVVRTFEPHRFEGGSLLSDFLTATDLDVRSDELTSIESMNQSLDAEAVELLRILNLHFHRLGRNPSRRLVNQIMSRLARREAGPTLTLPEPVLDEFMDRWQESNSAAAREFVPGRGDALFRSERKTQNTTTEQSIDPERFDQLLALLELPQDLSAALRRVAHEEAEVS